MARYGLVDAAHVVVDIVLWDGDAQAWSPPEGVTAIPSDIANKGDSYDPLSQAFTPPQPTPPTAADVDAERDRRVAGGFVFQGHAIQLDGASLVNVTAMGASARFAVLAGAAAGNLRWDDAAADFGWIATDNSVVPMDAPAMAAMADAAKAWVSAHVFAARALKTLDPIPADFAADTHWPAASA